MEKQVERVSSGALARRVDRRDQIEFIVEMSRYLAPAERVLVDYIYGQGRSVADYARLARCSVRTAQQRVRRILKRIQGKPFQYVVAHEAVLPADCRAVARRMILEGRGLRTTARLTGRSLHQVRRQHTELRAVLALQIGSWSPPAGAAEAPPMVGGLD